MVSAAFGRPVRIGMVSALQATVECDTIVYIQKVDNVMKIYVAEINGRPIAAFNASTLTKAAEVIENPSLIRDDLVAAGLCDEDADISFRPASAEEIAEWNKLNGRSIMLGEFGPREGEDEMLGLIFLVDVVDPTSENMET